MSKQKDSKQKSLMSFFGKPGAKPAASAPTQKSNGASSSNGAVKKAPLKTPAPKKIDTTLVVDSPAPTSALGSGSSVRGTSPPTSDPIDVDMEVVEDATKEVETRPVS